MKKILVLILFINISIFGQQANDLKSAKINFKISTEDGKIYKVTNLRENKSFINIQTIDGSSHRLNKKDIISIREIIKNIEYFDWKREGFTKYVVVKFDSIKKDKLYNLTLNLIKEHYDTPSKVIKAEIENKKIRVGALKKNLFKEKIMGTRYFDATYSFEISFRDGKYKFEPLYLSRYIATSNDWLLISQGEFAHEFYNSKGKIKKSFKYFPTNSENLFNNLNISLYNYILENKTIENDDW